MANWKIQNCLDPTDTKIVNDKKNQLQTGSVLPAGTPGPGGEITGCYSAVEETDQFQNYQIFGDSLDCVDCLDKNNFKLIFRNCLTEINYYVSPIGFETLPIVGKVFSGSISEIEGCYEFIGLTSEDLEISSSRLVSEYNNCLGCQGGFSVSFDREILINNSYGLDKGDVLSISGDYTEPFTYFISDDNQVENVRIEGSTLYVGDSTGALGIMVVDSNNFSATTTTEVLKRASFTTNRDEIINNVSYQDFKQKNIKDNYNSIIQNRINPQSQEQAK
jgi:hypothetical protein